MRKILFILILISFIALLVQAYEVGYEIEALDSPPCNKVGKQYCDGTNRIYECGLTGAWREKPYKCKTECGQGDCKCIRYEEGIGERGRFCIIYEPYEPKPTAKRQPSFEIAFTLIALLLVSYKTRRANR
jgi:hypothetical protein